MKSKKAEFNFVLIMAIIAGTMILLLAIYGAIKGGVGISQQSNAEIAKTLEIITNPLEAGFAEAATSRIQFKTETRILNDCSDYEDFGKNDISVITKSSIGEEWSSETTPISIHNKYIFSEYEEGKLFYVFSKPFELSFKVADLLFITSKDYCMVNPPDAIREELIGLNIKNIGIRDDYNDTCKEDSVTVCFDFGNCNITVTGECNDQKVCESDLGGFDYGYVTKANEKMYYSGSLLYGAIFSEKNLYDCNLNRLFYRTSKIAEILSKKAELMNARGCNTLLGPDMASLAQITASANPEDLGLLYGLTHAIPTKSEKENCPLW